MLGFAVTHNGYKRKLKPSAGNAALTKMKSLNFIIEESICCSPPGSVTGLETQFYAVSKILTQVLLISLRLQTETP